MISPCAGSLCRAGKDWEVGAQKGPQQEVLRILAAKSLRQVQALKLSLNGLAASVDSAMGVTADSGLYRFC